MADQGENVSVSGSDTNVQLRLATRLSTDVTVSQVLGLMEDLINAESDDLPPRTQSKLKQICDMLRQASGPAATASDAPLSSDAVSTMAAHDPNVMHQQEEAAAGKVSKPIRRYSQSVWSTVTTATGMPAVEEQSSLNPTAKRRQMLVASNSISYNDKRQQSMFRRRLSTGQFNRSQDLAQLGEFRRRTASGLLGKRGSGSSSGRASPNLVDNHTLSFTTSNGLLSVSAPGEGSTDSPLNSDPIVVDLQYSLPNEVAQPSQFFDPVGSTESIAEEPREETCKPLSIGIPKQYIPSILAADMAYDGQGLVATDKMVDNDDVSVVVNHELDEPAIDADAVLSGLTVATSTADAPLLEESNDWNFPIFELACETGGHVLSILAQHLFETHNLFSDLNINREKFVAYFEKLETGYRDNPYHNRIHAADVLHSTAYLLNSDILGFCASVVEDKDLRTVVGHDVRDISRPELIASLKDGRLPAGSCGPMRDALSSLELAACFIAAAQHDYDHPARTNAFLVTTQSNLAIMYNDRAVLEQHHAASSWHLLLDNPEYNFLENMPAADIRVLRFLSLEMILATDLAKHFDMIRTFKANVSNGKIFMKTREDRLSVMQMCIKLADINGPAKCGPLYRKWAYLICEEFYDQGEEEAKLDLQISPYMDRHNPLLPKLQTSFIVNLLQPLLAAYASAGFMPGPYELNETYDLDENVEEAAAASTCGDDQAKSTLGELHSMVVSQIVKNAQDNENFWKNVMKKEEEEKKKREDELFSSPAPMEV
ncbi:cGMP-inhibited 3',5'-cyclic phosphodiesterase 3A-like [Sycon ciliatum]|uniref:cGMP-inhibited 3',5'-cyclic phosphodiesterase 3A-like n=1 Tax=Sycon ciliatum TaxID=27933 RepID=UPI0020AA2786|eukprot:scpid36942/ scgid19887/ cGMP-inhibited 3&apos; Cyclic GMP-inhibited phosphodiesterase A